MTANCDDVIVKLLLCMVAVLLVCILLYLDGIFQLLEKEVMTASAERQERKANR